MQKVTALAFCLLLSSCAVFEGFGLMPSRSAEVSVSRGQTASNVFTCVERTIIGLSKTRSTWATSVTRKDEKSGIFETGNYGESNVIGFRVRAIYSTGDQKIRLKLKGAGPYYSDIGVDEGIEKLASGIKQCV